MWHAWSERWPRSPAPLLLVLVGCAPGGNGTPQASSVSQTTPAGAVPPAPTARVSPPAPTASARASGPTTSLFFGDSYIVGGGYTGPKNSMGAIAARRLGWKYQIRGGGGTGFVSGNPDYGIPSFLGQIRAGALDVGPVDWLVIEGGGNDKNDDPGWSPGARSGPSRPRRSGTRRPGWCWSGRWTRPSTASPTPTA